MKKTLLACLSSIALGFSAFAQTPAAPATSEPPASSPALAATAAPAVAASAKPDRDESIEDRVARKLKHKFGIDIDLDNGPTHVSHHSSDGGDDDIGSIIAIPIVAI